jgi:hypothetical protein
MATNDENLRDLMAFTDEHGVLSFYVGHAPSKAADPQPTAPIELRNQTKSLLTELERRDADLARAVHKRLDASGPSIEALVDPKAQGRGRALFIGVGSGQTRALALQIPFRERVVHHDSAFVRPLVAAFDEGRPAGVLVVSRSGARILRWALGEVEQLTTSSFELTDAQLADIGSGPAPSNPQNPHHSYVDRDGFEHRIEENRHRFLKEAVDDVVARAKEHGWDRIVVSGPPKLREATRELFPSDDSLRVLIAEQAWEDTAPHVIAEQAWPLLRSIHRERERQLADLAVERTFAGGPGAVGLRNVCAALNEGRVSRLLFASDLQLEGFLSEEGTLHPRVAGVVAESDLRLTRQPLFVERMIEKALATGASVTPIEPDVTDALAEHEGVAALLRW